MFTIEQIKEAHSKVRSGADFPSYIRDIKAMGVKRYETFVTDGHTDYHGDENFKASSSAGYDNLEIADQADAENFRIILKDHQAGHTDYARFCKDSAASGVLKWIVSMEGMTCTYYDKKGAMIMQEEIPS